MIIQRQVQKGNSPYVEFMKSSVVSLSVLVLAASRFIVLVQGRTDTDYFTRGRENSRFWESIPDKVKPSLLREQEMDNGECLTYS